MSGQLGSIALGSGQSVADGSIAGQSFDPWALLGELRSLLAALGRVCLDLARAIGAAPPLEEEPASEHEGEPEPQAPAPRAGPATAPAPRQERLQDEPPLTEAELPNGEARLRAYVESRAASAKSSPSGLARKIIQDVRRAVRAGDVSELELFEKARAAPPIAAGASRPVKPDRSAEKLSAADRAQAFSSMRAEQSRAEEMGAIYAGLDERTRADVDRRAAALAREKVGTNPVSAPVLALRTRRMRDEILEREHAPAPARGAPA